MTIVRKHDLIVGGWARDMQGDVCKIVGERLMLGKVRELTVRYPAGRETTLIEGMLESVPSEFAP